MGVKPGWLSAGTPKAQAPGRLRSPESLDAGLTGGPFGNARGELPAPPGNAVRRARRQGGDARERHRGTRGRPGRQGVSVAFRDGTVGASAPGFSLTWWGP